MGIPLGPMLSLQPLPPRPPPPFTRKIAELRRGDTPVAPESLYFQCFWGFNFAKLFRIQQEKAQEKPVKSMVLDAFSRKTATYLTCYYLCLE